MTTNETSVPTIGVSRRARPGPLLILAAIGFVLLYLSTNLAGSLASSALPLPNAPVAETRAWFAENQLAAVVNGLCQFLSVAALAVFVTRFGKLADAGLQNAARWATVWGLAAVGLMMLSSVIAWLMAALAPGAGLGTMSVLRTANFIAGGTAHVVALGIFVLLVPAPRDEQADPGVRVRRGGPGGAVAGVAGLVLRRRAHPAGTAVVHGVDDQRGGERHPAPVQRHPVLAGGVPGKGFDS